jgi:hypothetical protein
MRNWLGWWYRFLVLDALLLLRRYLAAVCRSTAVGAVICSAFLDISGSICIAHVGVCALNQNGTEWANIGVVHAHRYMFVLRS